MKLTFKAVLEVDKKEEGSLEFDVETNDIKKVNSEAVDYILSAVQICLNTYLAENKFSKDKELNIKIITL